MIEKELILKISLTNVSREEQNDLISFINDYLNLNCWKFSQEIRKSRAKEGIF